MGGPLESDDGCLTSCGSSLWAQHKYINIGIVVDRMRLESRSQRAHMGKRMAAFAPAGSQVGRDYNPF